MKIKKLKFIEIWVFAGIFFLPLIFWPWAKIPYEIPKVWFFHRWVEGLGIFGLFGILGKAQKKEKKNRGNKKNLLIFAVVGFVLVSVISSLFGTDFLKSVFGNYYRSDGLLTLFHLTGLFCFLFLYWEKSWEKLLTVVITAGSLILSIWTLLLGVLGRLGIMGIIGGSMFGKAIGGTFGNPNFLAGYLLVSLPFTIYSFKKLGVLGWLGILMQAGAIGLTFSRAGIIGVFFLGIGYFWERIRKLGKFGMLGILGILIFLSWKEGGVKYSPESRQRIVVRGIKGWQKRPILGYGTANFNYAFESNFYPIKYNNDIYVDKAHSNLLEVLTTTGIIGLAMYLGIIFFTLRELVGRNKEKEGKGREVNFNKTLLFSFLLFLFHSQTNIISINEEMFFWLIAGIVASGSEEKKVNFFREIDFLNNLFSKLRNLGNQLFRFGQSRNSNH